MKKKWIEAGKLVLIVALTLSAVLLLARIALSHNGVASTQDVFKYAQRLFARAAAVQTVEVEAEAAAKPVQAAVVVENGRYGIVSGFEALDELYNSVSTVFFGSARLGRDRFSR